MEGALVFDKEKFGWTINNRQFLPDSYTRFQDKIGLADENRDLLSTAGKIELVFSYKDCVLEGAQTKENQNRSEIFYNKMLAPDEIDRLLYPRVLVNAECYTVDGEEPVARFEINDNLIINGNSLLAVSSLLKKYEDMIKRIYIDRRIASMKEKRRIH